MKVFTNRIARSLVFGLLTASILAFWRYQTEAGSVTPVGLAISAFAFALGGYVGDLLRDRFLPDRKRSLRRRPVLIWALGLSVLGAVTFSVVGFAHDAHWTISQWTLALISGGVVGAGFGALLAVLSNAQRSASVRNAH